MADGSGLLVLPEEMLIKIAKHLDFRSVVRLGSTCKQLLRISQAEAIWRPLVHQIFCEAALMYESMRIDDLGNEKNSTGFGKISDREDTGREGIGEVTRNEDSEYNIKEGGQDGASREGFVCEARGDEDTGEGGIREATREDTGKGGIREATRDGNAEETSREGDPDGASREGFVGEASGDKEDSVEASREEDSRE
jgi:hypothetical protein